MPYIARRRTLPEVALTGGFVDPRAKTQPSFSGRMTCRDVTDFISNITKFSPLAPRLDMPGADGHVSLRHGKPDDERRTQVDCTLDKILARSDEIKLESTRQGGQDEDGGYKFADQPLSDLVPGLVVSGGLSRSPAFDCLPAVSRFRLSSGPEDPNATFQLTSTWGTAYVVGEGSVMEAPLGAPVWSLKTHAIAPTKPGSSKFCQRYDANTDTLTTTVNLARRLDTARTGGVLCAISNVSWMRNARVADAVDCAAGLLSDAAALLAARDNVLTTGETQRLPFAEIRPVVMPTWCSARRPLPPKLSGVALSQDQATLDLLAAEGCNGSLVNASIFSMAVGYNRGVYGGSISGLWAIMDSAFVLDYTIGTKDSRLADSISGAFAEVAAVAETAASAGPHITDIRVVKGCNYACLRQKTVIEDTTNVDSAPCIVVWDDLSRLARYKLADAVFCHVYYDSGGGEEMAAMAGLGCVVHDWIDLGADVSCGEVSNIIPSLTRGSLDEEPLLEVYSRLAGAMIWYRDNDLFNPAALCILYTHWWQLANCRHRPISLLGRTDLDVTLSGVAATVPSKRPTLDHFRAQGTKVERGHGQFAKAEARLKSVLESDPLPETLAVIDLLVRPTLDYVRGASDELPAESEYLAAVLAAEVAYPQGKKVLELWDLAIVMWESGAMWAAGVASLCYTHTGKTNCDRARGDLAGNTWM
ncbi:hypothetical protein V8F33_011119 [Rhypophila sp. PSN 637]